LLLYINFLDQSLHFVAGESGGKSSEHAALQPTGAPSGPSLTVAGAAGIVTNDQIHGT